MPTVPHYDRWRKQQLHQCCTDGCKSITHSYAHKISLCYFQHIKRGVVWDISICVLFDEYMWKKAFRPVDVFPLIQFKHMQCERVKNILKIKKKESIMPVVPNYSHNFVENDTDF